jgi:hypothetical protein
MLSLNEPIEFTRFMSDSRPIDLEGIDWDAIPNHAGRSPWNTTSRGEPAHEEQFAVNC